ncbi:hypothetical protein ACCC88_00280 [Sphingomonas sp. Sphisp140]|uniref:hypothetical protein n=1 Tax=unclassified Sphingomonas TaxID=196159 RepID=UPI0039AF50E9
MSDILEDAERLLAQLPDAVDRRRLGQRLSQALVSLRTVDHQVARMTALIELAPMIEFGATEEQREAREEMIEIATDLGEMLEKADSEEALRLAIHEYDNGLPPAIRGFEQHIRERWRVVVGERFAPMVGIGQLLSAMNVPDDLGGRLAACGNQAKNTASLGTVTDLLPQVRCLMNDYATLQAERAREIGEDEVGEFINALAERRATLAMVTDKVRAWLEAHEALDRLGVNTR